MFLAHSLMERSLLTSSLPVGTVGTLVSMEGDPALNFEHSPTPVKVKFVAWIAKLSARIRNVTDKSGYLESILQQNQLLRARVQSGRSARDTPEAAVVEPTHNHESTTSTEPSRNPVLENNPWFIPLDSFQVPLRVGESADTAFATRVRQLASATAPTRLVSAIQPRIRSIWTLLDRFVENPASLDMFSKSKIFALLALGKLYSSRYELLSAYERWHSAYFLASSATRHCAVMGLNFNIPETHLHDGAAREHLIRVWWTSYLLDHTCAAINGQMVSIQDYDVCVSFPSSDGLNPNEMSEFANPHYMSARVELVRILSKIIKSLYGRANQSESFLQRVQNALKGLKSWLQRLPEPLRMNQAVAGDSGAVRSLHLFFNQCMIMTSRPLLLHVIQHQKEMNRSSGHDTPHPIHENIQAIVTSCIRLLNNPENARDLEDFKLCDQLLKKLKDSGSLPAMEFYQHLEALKIGLATFTPTRPNSDGETTLGTPRATNVVAHILHLSAAGEYIDSLLRDLEEFGIREDGSTRLDHLVKLRLDGWPVGEVNG
ncbi:uncharacterized protein NECHADRAFT_88291 [Fusarium vanettenii 77-13-4]|uniref:Xylanolytic transcriptional activator regulatory domain-containing protein n=1 Tax=Fusarium vanettenii (strain ATCC MYA-4622 / CBS 123669 / FGSC 9596 / NRRL 45880 / 77-13-4) TaxID=660122 RepID=C7ZE23_FUSV7|nr:uncharacterized protein NECHADRAFT_88291 [Fusarium vanettenii 77-13-4]EEU37830.1 hypothetical protein NECHADRAFT_88291 [Fusarium vanettenii 77-13-4]